MRTLIPLKLYSTSHCHLCEEAQAQLENLQLTKQLTIIDIAEDDALLDLYGTRIPVLQRVDNAEELNWPFNKSQVKALLEP